MPTGLEIERKFLVQTLPAAASDYAWRSVLQGYILVCDDGAELRLRKIDSQFRQTIKSSGEMVRGEIEIALSQEQYEALWPATAGMRLEKKRCTLLLESGRSAEIDAYEGSLAGLMVAEVEFESEREANEFVPPAWFGREITKESAYKNRSLAKYGRPYGPSC